VNSYLGTTSGGLAVTAYFNGVGAGNAPADSCQIPALQLNDQIPPASVSGQTPAPYRLGQDGVQFRGVEFVRRFYRESKLVATSGWQGQYGDAQQFFWNPGFFGLESYPNGGTVAPALDDIVGFGPVAGLSNAGHVAIVTSVTNTCASNGQFSIGLIEQNTIQAHQLTGTCPLQSGGGYIYTLSSRCAACLPVQGWVRLPDATYVTFSFTGEITSVNDPNGLLHGSIAGGSTLTGEFSYDTSASASTSNSAGQYQFNGGPVWMSITVPTAAGPVNLGASSAMQVEITPGAPGVFNQVGNASPATWPLPLPASSPYILVQLNSQESLFSSDALPTSIDFQLTEDYAGDLGSSFFGAGQGMAGFTVQFRLTSLTKNSIL
jgi:hypothetical protein